ncbi:MAG: DUF4351 domain-containing protein [Gammaproteobacteria bacterium]|jgi:hypothetical protein|nr:DUF4351 domain-containing protein [Gammaproteobacteria bacterium]MBT5235414.1 DUF4351 domain-containing protein [Candidatus Neomarinimicrobiota bacterium]MBT6651403.1 DUF4351 domain-containing protein [Gammaproteobacteria bacterium]
MNKKDIVSKQRMIKYQPDFLDNREIFTKDETRLLEELCRKVPLDKFLNNQSYVEKFGFDFIYTSVLIEGNSYDKLDTQALGMQQGIQQGEVALLVRLIEKKFGPLDLQTTQKLENATTDQLEQWASSILEANTLEELFPRH